VLLDHEENGGDGSAPPPFSTRTARALVRFVRMLDELIDVSQHEPVGALLREVLDRVDYRRYLLDGGEGGEERWANVEELCNMAAQYDEAAEQIERDPDDDRPDETVARSALAAFLEDVALVSDVDELDQRQDAVTLITLHAAKGLEFRVVFLVGLEEGLLPHIRSLDDPSQMEEERRLCYVGMTRARERLHLSHALRRVTWGSTVFHPVSRFLGDIPPALTSLRGRAGRLGPARGRSLRERMVELASQPAAEPPASGAAFEKGDVVRHAKFGDGIVVGAEPRAGDVEVTVAFKGSVGVKKMLLSFAPLEKVVA
jgi:DNA helicase-2/ATP-dependent DNA helicase PcrA